MSKSYFRNTIGGIYNDFDILDIIHLLPVGIAWDENKTRLLGMQACFETSDTALVLHSGLHEDQKGISKSKEDIDQDRYPPVCA